MKTTMEQPSCKFSLLRLFTIICTTLVSTLSFGQAGNAPMQTLPQFPGPFAIDGFLQRQGVNGDWLPAAGGSANNFVLNNAGVPVVPLAYHLIDLYNDQVSDDIFDGGNKLNDNPNVWGWRSQKPPAKDDINNATVFLALNPANQHIWTAISGDRMATNGTSYIDFEFYQNSITKIGGPLTGGFLSTGPHNGRTVGDLSLTLQYTGGGSFASVFYLQWQPGAEAGTYDYFEITPAAGTAFAAANGGVDPINVPYGAFGATQYTTLQYVEGAVDMTTLIGGIGLPGECGSLPFKSVFVKTKSSAAATADLKDMIAPLQINVCFDHTAPTIQCPNTLNLGCNPTIPAPSGATASDNCDGTVIPVASDGPVQSSGCSRTMNRTWIATDDCGNMTSCIQVINWTQDNTAPSISTGGTSTTIGCNPSANDINNALGSASATDACGAPTFSFSDGSVSSDGCSRSQTRTWTARDACGNTSTASRTVNWTADVTPPSISANGTGTSLGCNPSAGAIDAALGSASATDACGPTTVTSSDGSVQSSGCTRTQTRTFTARDGCGNTATTSRTVNWTSDLTPPVFTSTPASVDLNCAQSVPAIGSASATDACGPTTVTLTGSTDNPANCSTGFQRIITRTWTARDGCGNTAQYTQTIRVKCCEPACTLTQGAYGNPGGNICLPNGTTVNQTQIMINALTAAPGNMKVFGRQDLNRYWVIRLTDVNQGNGSNIFHMLPGGGPSKVFGADNVAGVPEYSNTPSWPIAPLQAGGPQAGKIRNQLFSQTLTLWFNSTITGNTGISNLILNGDSVIVADRNCGDPNPVPGTQDTISVISQTIVNYMSTHGYAPSIAGLLQLANDALGGVNVSPLSLDDIQGAVGGINEAFDNCRLVMGYVPFVAGRVANVTNNNTATTSAPSLNVTAFPNPYEENFSLRVNSPVTGQALIGFYTIDGVKIGEMKRDVTANKDVWVPYNVPAAYRTRIVYTVNVGSYNAKGIVLSPNEPKP